MPHHFQCRRQESDLECEVCDCTIRWLSLTLRNVAGMPLTKTTVSGGKPAIAVIQCLPHERLAENLVSAKRLTTNAADHS